MNSRNEHRNKNNILDYALIASLQQKVSKKETFFVFPFIEITHCSLLSVFFVVFYFFVFFLSIKQSNDFCSGGKKEWMLIGLKTIECNYIIIA